MENKLRLIILLACAAAPAVAQTSMTTDPNTGVTIAPSASTSKRLGSAAASNAGVTSGVITFDDISLPPIYNSYGSIPNGYQGLNWNNFYVIYSAALPLSGYAAGMVSFPNAAFNSTGAPASLSSTTPFTFTSGYFTAAWNDGLTVQVQGLNSGTVLYTQSLVLSAATPMLVTFNWQGVTEVDFAASGGTLHAGYNGGPGTQFVMDNLSIVASGCGDERDTLIAEYSQYDNIAAAMTIGGAVIPFNPAPDCNMFTQGYPTFDVNNIDPVLGSLTSWELVRTPMYYNFFAWQTNYGAPLTITSSYRTPAYNANLQPAGAPGSRHVIGDAIDCFNDQYNQFSNGGALANWQDLVQAAQTAGASWIEGQASTYPCRCTVTKCNCVHADWRYAPGPYLP
jgi:hypothetical protein